MSSTTLLLITFVVALAACSIGFKEFVWFMSVGYGFAIMAIGAFLLVYSLLFVHGTVVTDLICVFLIIYGYRLGAYLYKREKNNLVYRKTLEETGSTKKVPVFVGVFMWLFCGAMYVAQCAAVSFRLYNGDSVSLFSIIGLVLVALGVCGEALADKQKSEAKAKNPRRFCDTGLYKIVRCPNYFSEITVWTGVILSGIGSVTGKQWIICVIGYILIVIVMVNGAQRLEKRQNKNYGSDPEYVKYSNSTPILFPFVPLYHLNKEKK